jgi:hypothetical protein
MQIVELAKAGAPEPERLRIDVQAELREGVTSWEQTDRIGDGAPAGRALDPHSKRILLDHAEWYTRLTKLAELRQGGD